MPLWKLTAWIEGFEADIGEKEALYVVADTASDAEIALRSTAKSQGFEIHSIIAIKQVSKRAPVVAPGREVNA